jgi:hypothetical protein
MIFSPPSRFAMLNSITLLLKIILLKKNVYLQVEIHVVGSFLQLHINNKQKVHQTHH